MELEEKLGELKQCHGEKIDNLDVGQDQIKKVYKIKQEDKGDYKFPGEFTRLSNNPAV